MLLVIETRSPGKTFVRPSRRGIIPASAGSRTSLELHDPYVAFVLGEGKKEPLPARGPLAADGGPLGILEMHQKLRLSSGDGNPPDITLVKLLVVEGVTIGRPDRDAALGHECADLAAVRGDQRELGRDSASDPSTVGRPRRAGRFLFGQRLGLFPLERSFVRGHDEKAAGRGSPGVEDDLLSVGGPRGVMYVRA